MYFARLIIFTFFFCYLSQNNNGYVFLDRFLLRLSTRTRVPMAPSNGDDNVSSESRIICPHTGTSCQCTLYSRCTYVVPGRGQVNIFCPQIGTRCLSSTSVAQW
uniref:Secreted protein n=1 Tax=Cacopsylla melanoneura TaxID=428564 RepID=A0A8D8X236_9HEMI